MGPFRRRIPRLLVAVACLIALGWAIKSLGPRRIWQVSLRADPFWLALSVLPVLGRFLIWGQKWRRMLARRSAVPYGTCLRLLVAGSFVNLTTPTAKLAGGVVRALFLQRRTGWGMATAYGWAMADQVTNVLGHVLLYGLLAPAAAFAVPAGPHRTVLLLSGLAVLALLTAGAALRGWAWSLLFKPAVSRRLARMAPADRHGKDRDPAPPEGVQEVFRPLLRVGGPFRAFFPDLIWAAAAFASLCLANAMVIRSLGAAAPVLLVSAAVVLAYFAGVLVGAWGGIGVTEVALTGLYVQIGLPPDQAAAGALLHRAIFYAVVLAWGGLALIAESRRGGTGAAAGHDQATPAP